MSPNFHWQKNSLTVGCNSLREKTSTLTPFVKPHEVLRGYFDVAIAKNSRNLHAILCNKFANRGYLDVAIAEKFAKLACNLELHIIWGQGIWWYSLG